MVRHPDPEHDSVPANHLWLTTGVAVTLCGYLWHVLRRKSVAKCPKGSKTKFSGMPTSLHLELSSHTVPMVADVLSERHQGGTFRFVFFIPSIMFTAHL
jgi:hypothetical protein